MARIIPIPGADGRGTQHYKAVDESGRALAVGTLEVDMIPGAQRHGSIAFVTPPNGTTEHEDAMAALGERTEPLS